MPIKNYTTKVPALQTVGELQGILAAHGAKKIMIDYDDTGKAVAITFALSFQNMLQGYRLEPKTNGVLSKMSKDKVKCGFEQAERIAWRNIKDWAAAQIALIESEQASMDEIFLPYLTNKNEQTLYEMISSGALLLNSGAETT